MKIAVAAKMYNVLFVCTGNSARSIMAEVILNHLGRDRFQAYSAGSHPRGEVHPMTLEVLSSQGYDVCNVRSKRWTKFAEPLAPSMDFIFTVCDTVGGETCPVWPGQPITAHWSFANPAAMATGKQLKAFTTVQFEIANRIRLFMSLPIAKIDRLSLQTKLRGLGQLRNEPPGG